MFLRTIALVILAIPLLIVGGFLVSIWSGGCVPYDVTSSMCRNETKSLFLFGVMGSLISVLVLTVWFLSSIFRVFGLNEK